MTIPTDTRPSTRRFSVAAGLCVIVLGVMGYANTLTGEFVWDDVSSVLLHRHVQDPSKFFELFREDQHAFSGGQGNFYRPLVSASFMLDYAIANDPSAVPAEASGSAQVSPFLFHLTNVAWHVAAALLFLVLLTRLGAPEAVRAAAPLLYVIHPLHTEAVAYISGRADSMAAAFTMAGLCSATCDESNLRRLCGLLLSQACFAAALLSKESALIFPALLAVCLLCRSKDSRESDGRRWWAHLTPVAFSMVILGVYVALRATVLDFGSDSVPRELSMTARVIEMLKSFAIYGYLIVFPTGLHMERTAGWMEGIPSWTAVAGLALLAGCIAGLVLSLRARRHRAAAGMTLFLCTWFPISGIFPLNAPMAEHWMYLPLAGLFWALCEWIAPAFTTRRLIAFGAAALYGACALFLAWTVSRNRDWRDNESIYLSTLAKSPDSLRVRYNLAVTYEDLQGNAPGARRQYEKLLEGYDREFRRLVAREPGAKRGYWQQELRSHLSLANLYLEDTRYRDAAEHFGFLLSIAPDDTSQPIVARAMLGLGKCYLATGDRERALNQFQRAVGLEPALEGQVRAIILNSGMNAGM